MMGLIIGLVSGSLFGAGLVVAQMTDPSRVLGFLDVLGHWDPRLGLVMLGAIAVHAPCVMWARRRRESVVSGAAHLPTQTRIDVRLVSGAAVFGVGWGLAGYCPGPAIVAASTNPSALVFAVSMIGGMLIHDGLLSRRVLPAILEPGAQSGKELAPSHEVSA